MEPITPFPILRAFSLPSSPPLSPLNSNPGNHDSEYESDIRCIASRKSGQLAMLRHQMLAIDRRIDALFTDFMQLGRREHIEGTILRPRSVTSGEAEMLRRYGREHYKRVSWLIHAQLINMAATVYNLHESSAHRRRFEQVSQKMSMVLWMVNSSPA
ncbi:hypothetical protein CERSUDRAFT_98308 [Gelatoporia subvermispora B]|uniref:Uncharacterized protein n=1 Tax=Ceriporiopsis subvermispora (strain B) TaxID=914234 RepID=M2R6F8_CERS8|nr:hypothetical protein CERSUDRAFT_98308 [Gelatoporia subvermispora B]